MHLSAIHSFRCRFKSALFAVALTLAFAAGVHHVSAALLAYEGFDYEPASDMSGQGGGFGWAGPWTTANGDTIVGGSLSYTDTLGNTLNTSGNRAFISSQAQSANVQCFRTNSFFRLDGSNVTWISFLAARSDNDVLRAAGVQIHTNASSGAERLSIGKGTTTDTSLTNWGMLYGGSAANSVYTTTPLSQPSFFVARLDHNVDAADDAYLFVNPTLSSEPSILSADAQFVGISEMSFGRMRIFVGQSGSGANYVELGVDEIRIGETYADVTPHTPGGGSPQPQWLSISRAGTDISLQLTGAVSSVYDVLATSTVTDTSPWPTIGQINTDANGLGSYTDTNAVATNSVRYYRAKEGIIIIAQ